MAAEQGNGQPIIEVKLTLDRKAKNPIGLQVSVWRNGSRKTVWGEGATIDEAWDWAKNELEFGHRANRQMLDDIMPLYNARFPEG